MDWKNAQTKLEVTPDGVPGPKTYKALFEFAAGRPLGRVGDALARSAAKHFSDYGMTTPERLSEFVAQIANETGGFKLWEEDLRYTKAGMLKTWPKHFNAALADWALGSPYKIAEVAYGIKSRQGHGRMGNTLEGSGYKYRGRGALQLTGYDNYREFGKFLNLDLVKNPDLASDPENSLLIALEFFRRGKVNAAVDRKDYVEARRITNGGSIGLIHVANYRNKILSLFK